MLKVRFLSLLDQEVRFLAEVGTNRGHLVIVQLRSPVLIQACGSVLDNAVKVGDDSKLLQPRSLLLRDLPLGSNVDPMLRRKPVGIELSPKVKGYRNTTVRLPR